MGAGALLGRVEISYHWCGARLSRHVAVLAQMDASEGDFFTSRMKLYYV